MFHYPKGIVSNYCYNIQEIQSNQEIKKIEFFFHFLEFDESRFAIYKNCITFDELTKKIQI